MFDNLKELLEDEDIRVRRAVAQGLTKHLTDLPGAAMEAMLERFLKDEDPFVQKTLAEMAARFQRAAGVFNPAA